MATRTYRARAFLRAAERLRVAVTIGSDQEQPLARFTPGASIALDFARPERADAQIRAWAEQFPVDAVVGVDDDTTILAARAARALGLPHNSVDAVKAARYKDVFRLILSETDLNAPAFRLLELAADPRPVARAVRYPCVLKPLALSGSRGVIRVDTPQQFEAAVGEIAVILAASDLAADDPAAHHLLVEDFIPGGEVALEGLLVDGRLTTLALFDKPDPLDGPTFEETLYVTPSRRTGAEQEAARSAVERACEALGLREGPVHAEVRLNGKGAWVVEVAPRSIGGLCSDVLRFGADMSLEELLLRQAVRLDIPALVRERQPAGVMMIPIPAEGRLYAVHGLEAARQEPGIQDVVVSIPLGGLVVPLPRGDRYLGFIFARAESPGTVEAALRRAHALLRFDIRPLAREPQTLCAPAQPFADSAKGLDPPFAAW